VPGATRLTDPAPRVTPSSSAKDPIQRPGLPSASRALSARSVARGLRQFCLKAKTLLAEELGVPASSIAVVECDEDPDGNAIRAELGQRTGRTSMPSIWIRGAGYIGGCNDGPGIVPLNREGKLAGMLDAAGAR
jgi:glutaredoxin